MNSLIGSGKIDATMQFVPDTHEWSDMEPTCKPKKKSEYRLELVGEDILLYNPDDIKIISLNQTASVIWRLCDGTITVQQMIEALEEYYPDSKNEIAGDVNATLDQFLETGCVDLV
jgi:hypothetical protein